MEKGYKQLKEFQRHAVMELLDIAEPYLEKNDLLGFYKEITDPNTQIAAYLLNQAGYLTEFLEDCDIDTLGELASWGVIPYRYAYSYDRPVVLNSALIEDNKFGKTLHFPNYIHTIDNCAFEKCNCFETIDLRGVKNVGEYAFSSLYAHNVIANDSIEYMSTLAFEDTAIDHVYYEAGSDAKCLIAHAIYYGCENRNVEPEWIEI